MKLMKFIDDDGSEKIIRRGLTERKPFFWRKHIWIRFFDFFLLSTIMTHLFRDSKTTYFVHADQNFVLTFMTVHGTKQLIRMRILLGTYCCFWLDTKTKRTVMREKWGCEEEIYKDYTIFKIPDELKQKSKLVVESDISYFWKKPTKCLGC